MTKSIQIADEVYAMIENQAKANGRSVTEQIELYLENAFEHDANRLAFRDQYVDTMVQELDRMNEEGRDRLQGYLDKRNHDS